MATILMWAILAHQEGYLRVTLVGESIRQIYPAAAWGVRVHGRKAPQMDLPLLEISYVSSTMSENH